MTAQGDAALLMVGCPVCGARPYQPCSYVWPKGVPHELERIKSRRDLQRVAQVGKPTKQPHAARWVLSASSRQQRQSKVSARTFEHLERAAQVISKAETEWDRREVLRLRCWLSRYGGLLLYGPTRLGSRADSGDGVEE